MALLTRHMPATLLAVILTHAIAAPLRAQQPRLTWSRDVKAGIATARKSDRPLMFYVVNRRHGSDSERRRRHAAVFRDPRVAVAARPFITVEFAIDQHPEMIREWGLAQNVDRHIVFTTPAGDLVHQSGIGSAEALAEQIRRAYALYATRIWETELLPTLRSQSATEPELIAAVRKVRDLEYREGDYDVGQLLERPRVGHKLRALVYETLAVLSTNRSVETLLDAAQRDERAAAALAKCNPLGAERMIEWAGRESEALDQSIYEAVVRICKIPKAKSGRFWQNADEPAKAAELRRVRELAHKAATAYREQEPP